MILTVPVLLNANFLPKLSPIPVTMLVFGTLEHSRVLQLLHKIAMVQMLVSVLDQPIPLAEQHAPGIDNSVLLAKHLEVEFKLKLKLTVFQTICYSSPKTAPAVQNMDFTAWWSSDTTTANSPKT